MIDCNKLSTVFTLDLRSPLRYRICIVKKPIFIVRDEHFYIKTRVLLTGETFFFFGKRFSSTRLFESELEYYQVDEFPILCSRICLR